MREQGDRGESRGLEPQERQTLTERLRKLMAEPTGLAKQFKAQRLVGATGAELDDFRIICDIRPIFDQKREELTVLSRSRRCTWSTRQQTVIAVLSSYG